MRKRAAHTKKREKMAREPKRWIEERDKDWNTISMVHPGEVFPLFHLGRNGTTIRSDDNGLFGGIAARIRLHTGMLDPLNISIAAVPYALQRAAVLTPFDRRQGYPLDQEDFTLQSRYKKLARMKREMAEIVEGLGLVVFAAYEDLPLHSRIRTFQEDSSGFPPPNVVAQFIAPTLLESVYLTLTFPGGSSFIARASCHTNRLFLLFRTFFPTDTGPLPVADSVPAELDFLSIEEGFRLLLPFDADQVQAIRAKFLLLPGPDE